MTREIQKGWALCGLALLFSIWYIPWCLSKPFKAAPYDYPQITHSGAVGVRLRSAYSLLEMMQECQCDPYGQELLWSNGQPQSFPQW